VAEFLDRYIRQNAKSKIPEAWDRLVDSGPDDRLANLIMDEASKVSDYAPAKHDVIAFLSSLQSLDAQSSFSNQSHSSPSLLSPESKSKEKTRRKIIRGPIDYYLKGIAYQEQDATSAYFSIIKELGKENGFLQRLEPRFHSRKNKHVTRSRTELPGSAKGGKEVSRGWYLNTHMSNESKIKYLKIACEVARIAFGHRDGLKIELPNS